MEEIIKPNSGWGGDGETHSREKESLASIQLALGGEKGMWGRGRELATVRGSLSEIIFHHVTF